MAGMSFITAKSIVDEAVELREQMVEKAADAFVKSMNPLVVQERGNNHEESMKKMDALLKDFSMEDRWLIMKQVFIKMC